MSDVKILALSESSRDVLHRILSRSRQYPPEVSADWILGAVAMSRDELDQLVDDLLPVLEKQWVEAE